MRKLIFFAVLIVLSLAHPTKYKVYRNESCYEPTPAKIMSWHIHILYWGDTPKSVEGAMKVRDNFIEAFKNELGP